MTTFYISRHGETENNKARRLSGWIDTPLTEAGVKNAEASGVKLSSQPIEHIVSSDLGRAFTSAYIIAQGIGYKGVIERNSGLREMNYGQFANQLIDDFPLIASEDYLTYVMPGGESLQQMQQRILKTVHEISQQYPGQTVLIVAHDGTINSVRALSSGEGMVEADKVHNPHDFVARFEYDNGRVTAYQEVQ